MPICKICNKYFKQITESHLKIRHSISMKEYKSMFPDYEIFDKEDIELYKLMQKERRMNGSKEGFQKGHKMQIGRPSWNKGLTKDTDERVKKYSNLLKGRKLDIESRTKLSNSRKEGYRNGKIKPRKGAENPCYGRKLTEEHKMALLMASRRISSSGINKVEAKAYETLKNFGFKYTGDGSFWLKFKNGRRKNPDFIDLENKCAFEVYGDYWHRGEDPKEMIKMYEEIGWQCIILWENEINKKSFCQYMMETYDYIIGKDTPENNYSYLLKGMKNEKRSIQI